MPSTGPECRCQGISVMAGIGGSLSLQEGKVEVTYCGSDTLISISRSGASASHMIEIVPFQGT